jgi:hypothetical protein
VQFKCVQTPEKARQSVSEERIKSTGRLPKRTILPLFGFQSLALPALASLTAASGTAGGFMNLRAG